MREILNIDSFLCYVKFLFSTLEVSLYHWLLKCSLFTLLIEEGGGFVVFFSFWSRGWCKKV